MDDLLHFLGLGYFVFMGGAALWGIEDLVLPTSRRHRRAQPAMPVRATVAHSPADAGLSSR